MDIKKGKIRCKFCNLIYADALAAYNCPCNKSEWRSPRRNRNPRNRWRNKISRLQGASNSFRAMLMKKKGKKVGNNG